MEDAHITYTGLSEDSQTRDPISVFGVFDGHGGKEVAKFVKLKYAEVLLNLPSFQQGDYGTALKESFHKIDELLEDVVSPPLPSPPILICVSYSLSLSLM